jgi:hypothetical protein
MSERLPESDYNDPFEQVGPMPVFDITSRPPVVRLTGRDLTDLASIIAPGDANFTVENDGFSADVLRRIIARHVTTPPGEHA